MGDRKMTTTYRAIGNNEVHVGAHCIAKMYIRHDGERELRILQGMPRDETVEKLLVDCPEFCRNNGITAGTYPLLFSPKKAVQFERQLVLGV